MRKDRFGLYGDIVEFHGPADRREARGEGRLRLERDHPAAPAPARQKQHETALVGADVADDVAGPQVPANDVEFGFLIAEPGLEPPRHKSRNLDEKHPASRSQRG